VRVRVSACGSLVWSDDRLIWDDYLGHRQLRLVEGAERVLRWFVAWRELDSVRELGCLSLAEQMLRLDVLVAEGSARQAEEDRILRRWAKWGVSARAFHFATRVHRDTPVETTESLGVQPGGSAPAITKTYSGAPTVSLPAADVARPYPDLLDVLARRRSTRSFANRPLSLPDLSELLAVAGRPNRPGATSVGNVFKTSPSGGARHPIEVYVFARDVAGLDRGIHHYDMLGHALTSLGRTCTDPELVELAAGQEWVATAGALLIYTGVIERSQWKYPISRAYRVLMMDAGHLSQTVYLLATALGLGVTFTGAVRDEIIEDLLGCDPAAELVLGMSVLGTPEP